MTYLHKRYFIYILAIGFLIWLFATIAFRVAGQLFFITDSAVILSILYIVVVPVLGLVTVFTCRKFRLTGLENVAAGVLLVLPGMLIDTFVIQFLVAYFLICRKAMLPHLVLADVGVHDCFNNFSNYRIGSDY